MQLCNTCSLKIDVHIISRCDSGFVRAYLHGQNIATEPADHLFCGNNLPPKLVTTNPRLALIFSANGTKSGLGFRGHYQFVTSEHLIYHFYLLMCLKIH